MGLFDKLFGKKAQEEEKTGVPEVETSVQPAPAKEPERDFSQEGRRNCNELIFPAMEEFKEPYLRSACEKGLVSREDTEKYSRQLDEMRDILSGQNVQEDTKTLDDMIAHMFKISLNNLVVNEKYTDAFVKCTLPEAMDAMSETIRARTSALKKEIVYAATKLEVLVAQAKYLNLAAAMAESKEKLESYRAQFKEAVINDDNAKINQFDLYKKQEENRVKDFEAQMTQSIQYIHSRKNLIRNKAFENDEIDYEALSKEQDEFLISDAEIARRTEETYNEIERTIAKTQASIEQIENIHAEHETYLTDEQLLAKQAILNEMKAKEEKEKEKQSETLHSQQNNTETQRTETINE